ncbi:hypothetical protein B0J14DRAFT_589519 [Halenospora varia]|nr:hypothetical protein B0J14DRAFT_589519 [Halenospora varia]
MLLRFPFLHWIVLCHLAGNHTALYRLTHPLGTIVPAVRKSRICLVCLIHTGDFKVKASRLRGSEAIRCAIRFRKSTLPLNIKLKNFIHSRRDFA